MTRPEVDLPSEMRSVFSDIFSERSDLARFFGHYASHEFWIWANTYGGFIDERVRAVLTPFPPPESMSCGSNDDSERQFALSGASYYDIMERILNSIGTSWNETSAVLDFGCGIGRVSRLFAKHEGSQKFFGCDLNDSAIQWLRNELGFGHFMTGFAKPPLPLEDSSLDVIFSISVFTHLKAESQAAWLNEFRRVLKPGGILFQTVHGRHAMRLCNHYEQWRVAINVTSDNFDVLNREFSETGFSWVPYENMPIVNSDYGVSFQTEQYIQSQWTKGFELLGVWAGIIDGWQDLVALRSSDVVRIDPVWPNETRNPVESISLEAPSQAGIGQVMLLTAKAVGGEDVHYRFFVAEGGVFFRPVTEWQPSGVLEFIPWFPTKHCIVVHAASGPGIHSVPDAEAGCEIVVR
jgi:SAM-dependent methyltransferase